MYLQARLDTPYARLMRVHQPTGTWLLMWPCWWSVTLASPGLPDPLILLLFFVGAFLMRSAGCIINDIVDRGIDAEVARTRDRPLASGEVSVQEALGLVGVLLVAAFAVALLLGPAVALWSAAALPLVIAYPFMKRFTWWPQAFLGLTFNWGALAGTVAVLGEVTPGALFLYLGCIGWTLGYDTIYAHQDTEDDEALGILSAALKLGASTQAWLWGFYGWAVAFWVLAGLANGAGIVYFVALMPVAAHMAWQIRAVDLDDSRSCMAIFRSNAHTGILVMIACIAGKLL